MKKVLFLALAAGMFTFAACDSKVENQREENMERAEDAAEDRADAMEDAHEDHLDSLDHVH